MGDRKPPANKNTPSIVRPWVWWLGSRMEVKINIRKIPKYEEVEYEKDIEYHYKVFYGFNTSCATNKLY